MKCSREDSTSGSDACPFCDIASDEASAEWLVYSDSKILSFFPEAPVALGHLVVIPRDHARYLWELEDEALCNLIRHVKRFARSVETAVGSAGINIIQSNGAPAEQSVWHLHFHVVPRFNADPMYPIWPKSPQISDSAKRGALRLIKEHYVSLQNNT